MARVLFQRRRKTRRQSSRRNHHQRDEFTLDDETVTYVEHVNLAYPTPPSPDSRFTVTFYGAKEPKDEGKLKCGGSVEVKKKKNTGGVGCDMSATPVAEFKPFVGI